MRIYHILLLGVTALATLAACSDDDAGIAAETAVSTDESITPITFGLTAPPVTTTRAFTADTMGYTAWAQGVKLPLSLYQTDQGTTAATQKFYTLSNDTLAPATEGDYFYWRSPNDASKSVRGWFKPDQTGDDAAQAAIPDNETRSVPAVQTDGLASCDLLYCADTVINYDWPLPVYRLRYRHQMTWVTVWLSTQNASVTKETVKSGTVTFGTDDYKLALKGTYHVPSGATKGNVREVYGTWTRPDRATAADGDYGVITPRTSDNLGGLIGQFDALLIPQSVGTDSVFFALTTNAGKRYVYRPRIRVLDANGNAVRTYDDSADSIIGLNLHTGLHYTIRLRITANDKIEPDISIEDWTESGYTDNAAIDVAFWEQEPFTGTDITPALWREGEFTGTASNITTWGEDSHKPGTTTGDDPWNEGGDIPGTTTGDDPWDDGTTPGTTTTGDTPWNEGTTAGTTTTDDQWQLEKAGESTAISISDWLQVAGNAGNTTTTNEWVPDTD